ncbi:MAG: hypothetical protein HETSPECPRED_004534 [Heterodermia speciosa]|uniref:Aromatic amino acid beta-eliminating lyase/threonine aldolase domain-containing protein n=1 Tax=Heterodermia speciosa TaxID=116794 RepID=A0A8H3FD75_9LECA|nr:MAG: hypothetical protein HETSPECPRED_004534 [Heterodermia speciosa]
MPKSSAITWYFGSFLFESRMSSDRSRFDGDNNGACCCWQHCLPDCIARTTFDSSFHLPKASLSLAVPANSIPHNFSQIRAMTVTSLNLEHSRDSTVNGLSNGTGNTETVSNAGSNWSDPGPAAFDFRSDVTTRPTPAMLESLISLQGAGLGDDVFREDETTNNLESFVAELTGFPAALLVMSGTMGNQLSIRTHLQGPPHSVVADSRSHIFGWEAGGLASLSGAFAIPVTPSNKHHLTLSDIKSHAITSTDIHACPTRLICLENTLAGTILPLSSAASISTWARSQSPPINLHLDGARLWEAVSATASSEKNDSKDALIAGLKAYCAHFDSVSLCFSKGLGAPIGSIIIGSHAFVDRARHIRKGLGGGLRQAALITAPARVAVEQTFLGGMLRASHERATEVAAMWTQRGGRLAKETETNMVWLDLEGVGLGADGEEGGKGGKNKSLVEMALERGVRVMGGRLVVHYQISPLALSRLALLFDDIFTRRTPSTSPSSVPNGIKTEAEKLLAAEVE